MFFIKSARTHKYIRKYKRGDKWHYVYHSPKGSKRVPKEAIEIIKKLAEKYLHEDAKGLLNNLEAYSEEKLSALRTIADQGNEQDSTAAMNKLKVLGIDREKERLEETMATEEVGELTRPLQEAEIKSVKRNLTKIFQNQVWGYLWPSYSSSDVAKKLVRQFGSADGVKTAFENAINKSSIKEMIEGMRNFYGSFQLEGATSRRSGGLDNYQIVPVKESIKELERQRVLPEGYLKVLMDKNPNQDLLRDGLDYPSIEAIEEEKRKAEAKRLKREQAELERMERESRDIIERHGESVTKMAEYFGQTVDLEKKIKVAKGIEKFWGKDFKWEDFQSTFNHPEVDIKIGSGFWAAMVSNSDRISLSFSFVEKSGQRNPITSASRSVYKKEDGSIVWSNGVFSRPDNKYLDKYPGMANGLYGGVYNFLKKVTRNYTGDAKNNTKIIIGSAANHGFGNSYKGGLVWAKHNFDWSGGADNGYISNWKTKWKGKISEYGRKMGWSDSLQNEIKQKISEYKYPYQFMEMGFKLSKEQAETLKGGRLDADFKRIVERKGHIDLGEFICVHTATSWSSPTCYLWKNTERENHLRERREAQYGGQRVPRLEGQQLPAQTEAARARSSAPTPSSSTPSRSSTPSSIIDARRLNDYAQRSVSSLVNAWRPTGRNRNYSLSEARIRTLRRYANRTGHGAEFLRVLRRNIRLRMGSVSSRRFYQLLREFE